MVRTYRRRRLRPYRRRTYRTPIYRRRRRYTIGSRRLSKRRIYKRGRIAKMYTAPLPTTILCKFKFNDTWDLNLAINQSSSYINFYSNYPYDPVVSASVTSCSGFSTLMNIWARGICNAFKIRVGCMPLLGTQDDLLAYVFMQDHVHYFPSGLSRDFVTENSFNLKKKLITGYTNSNVPKKWITYYISIKKLEKLRELAWPFYSFHLTGGLQAAYTTYCTVGCVRAQSGEPTSVAAIRLNITGTYYCKLWDRKDLQQ